MPRFAHLALTARRLWRLTRLQDQQAAWLSVERTTPSGELSPRSFPRLHRALRRRVLQRIFAAFAPGADSRQTAGSYVTIFRIAACQQDRVMVSRVGAAINFCESI